MFLKYPGILVTDAKSLYDHLTKTGSVPNEKGTMIDLLSTRDLNERKAIKIMWLPNRHMVADVLTKPLIPNEVYDRFAQQGILSLVPTEEQEEQESQRLAQRRAQRQRAKERKQEKKQEIRKAILNRKL